MTYYRRILSTIIAISIILSSIMLPVYATGVTYKDWSAVYWTSADDGLSAIPSQYSFTLDGDTADAWDKTPVYQVIDSEEVNGKKNYLIIRLESPAARGRISNSGLSTYNPEVEGSLAYWINNIWTGIEPEDSSYIADPISGTAIIDIKGSLLNGSFKEYLVEKSWTMEGSTNAGVAETTITAKAVIPSASEIDYYVSSAKKIDGAALSTGSSFSSALTRTVKNKRAATHAKNPNGYTNVYVQGENADSGKLGMQQLDVNSTDTKRAWGMFWVSEDFFKNVKISNVGTDVVPVVVNLNTVDELRALGYSLGELVKMGVIEPPAEPVASDISISVEEAVPGYPVTVDYKYSHEEGKEQGNTKIYWYVSDSEDGTYVEISNAEGNNWIIQNICEERYIKAKVVPVTFDDIESSEDYFSENAIKVGKALKAFNPDTDGGWNLPSDMPEESPTEYKFFLKTPSNPGFTYHMLESETQDGEGRFLILQMGSMISNGKMTSDAANYKFDPTVKYSVAGWLNDVWAESASPGIKDYYNSGGNGPLNNNATAIDSNIKPYLVKHTWLTENSGGSLVPNDFIFEAKVTLLSTTEFFKHYHKFGKTDYGKAWLRTPTENNGNGRYFLINGGSNVWAKNAGNESNIHYYRPVYYLSEDFFKDVRLDTEAVGTEVAKMIRSVIPKEEMLSGKAKYTEEELTTVFGYPEKTGYAENAVVLGNLSVGETLTCEYDFNKNGLDADKSDETRYQWYRADSKDGELQLINNADDKDYKITQQDLGKFLAVEITVIDEEGAMCTPDIAMTGIAVSEKSAIKNEFVGLSEEALNDGVTKKATATLEVTNDSSNRVLTFVIAAYDSQNMMCDFNMQDILVESGTDDYDIYLTGLGLSNDYKYRIMVLDNSSNLRPLYVGEI